MTIHDFQIAFEQLSPQSIAWKGDNVGLLIGNPDDSIQTVMISLDATLEVAMEAKKKKANLIFTHHPLLFHPLKNIVTTTRIGKLVHFLVKNNINLFSAHTNLDSVQWGVNFVLAETLQLTNIKILSPLEGSFTKIVVFVPNSHRENVAEAMHKAGAGMFTKYDNCSFRTEGTGTFRGMADAKPFVGKVGKLEFATETRIEMLCETWKLRSVLNAMHAAHPYEEVAYDIYPLANENTEFGIGAIGNLHSSMSPKKFLSYVQKKLKTNTLRFAKNAKPIQRVAVCGGSGTEYISRAIQQKADAMITADVKYHTFQQYENRILLIDAGHFETEHLVLPAIAEKIKSLTNDTTVKVYTTHYSTNPVNYFT